MSIPATKRMRSLAWTVAGSLFLLGSGGRRPRSGAAPPSRTPKASTVELQAREMAILEDWLRKLPGRYELQFSDTRLLGSIVIPGPKKGEVIVGCEAIGGGLGVNCVMGDLGDLQGRGRVAGVVNLQLFGVNPDTCRIRMMSINARSIAQSASGSRRVNKVRFSLPCSQPGMCRNELMIAFSDDGEGLDFERVFEASLPPAGGGGSTGQAGGNPITQSRTIQRFRRVR